MSKKYNKKNNMKQAMYEMFGVGEEQKEDALYQEVTEEVAESVSEVDEVAENESEKEISFEEMIEEYAPAKKIPVSYFAPGTVFEGTLKAVGDVEIAGEFNGDVTSEGNVILSSAVCGNIDCSDLKLRNCVLVGNVEAKGVVDISDDSKVRGNIAASEVHCAGQINGDLNVNGGISLEKTASVCGTIKTVTISMEKGAVIKGGIEMDNSTRDER